MPLDTSALLVAAVFAVAVLYSSVGHAGASGYIAVMSLLSVAPADIKPTALALNVLVASIGSVQFARAGHLSWPLLAPFVVLSAPMAFLGGWLSLPSPVFKAIVGVVLLYSAWRFVASPPPEREPTTMPRALAVGVGGAIGLLSGLTGTGGGIFLTPVLLLGGWARAKNAAAVSAVFILVNSLAGLAGNVGGAGRFPSFGYALLVAAGVGGAIGSWMGSRRFEPAAIQRLLAAVLAIAGSKLLLAP